MACMHTMIRLEDGVLTFNFEGDAGRDEVDMSRWRRAILPATVFLRSVGGGALIVPHRPADVLR